MYKYYQSHTAYMYQLMQTQNEKEKLKLDMSTAQEAWDHEKLNLQEQL